MNSTFAACPTRPESHDRHKSLRPAGVLSDGAKWGVQQSLETRAGRRRELRRRTTARVRGLLSSWKWTQGKLIRLQGTNDTTSYCMTFETRNAFVIGDCAQPATLTAWEVAK